MEGSRQASEKSGGINITPRDILFECPACGKSLVVDETAEGLTIPCPQCHINVIVPPKQSSLAPPPSPQAGPPSASKTAKPEPAGSDGVQERLAALVRQLKELQTQRTELTGRVASRVNEVNRDLVLLARLETSQQQVIGELNQITSQLQGPGESSTSKSSEKPSVLGASVGNGRSRVSFRS
jgi:predicted RNA-binding Zn-ribbon protein involved in translation (DUF1610 family)